MRVKSEEQGVTLTFQIPKGTKTFLVLFLTQFIFACSVFIP